MSEKPTEVKDVNLEENSKRETLQAKLKVNEVKSDQSAGDAGKQEVVEETVIAQQLPMAFSIIKAPIVCPPGYRPDSRGKCRKIL
jgi:hypothetical protein